MNFQAYCLIKNGYKAYTLKMMSYRNSHGICIYQDKKNKKWNAIDYGEIYYTSANSISELLNKIYPGWIAYDLHNPLTDKIDKRYISSTKMYLKNIFFK